MSKKRILDEDDVRALTTSEIDEVLGTESESSGGGSSSGGGDFPDDYEGDITDEDIDNILNS